MEYSTNGKVTVDQKTQIQKAIMGVLNKFPSFGSNPKVNLHSKAIGEAINAVFWVISVKYIFFLCFSKFFQETPDMLIKGCVESSEFHALKLRNLKYFLS